MSQSPALRSMLLATVVAVAPAAFAQTTAGTSRTIVIPVVAQTASFISELTLFNPNGTDISVDTQYFDANNLASAGPKSCTTVAVPANRSVQFSPGGQCSLGSGNHFGLLVLSEQTQTLEFQGYARTQTPQGIGFSTEGFPIEHFNAALQHVAGLKRQSAGGGQPGYQTNCFVGSLGQAVSYELRLFDGATNVQIGSTLTGSLGAYQQLRYLDVFSAFPNGVGAPAGNFSNVRAQFTNVTGGATPLVGFCTVQENTNFAADFRIAKAFAMNVPAAQGIYVQGGNTFGATGVLGTLDGYAQDFVASGQRALRLAPATYSPNVIGGSSLNTAGNAHGVFIGGGGAAAGSDASDLAAGPNKVTDNYGVVAGGAGNVAGDGDALPGTAPYATVAGGRGNIASGPYSVVSGGMDNVASGHGNTIAGGAGNTTSGNYNVIVGGADNYADGTASVALGSSNSAIGFASVAMGAGASAVHTNTFVWSDAHYVSSSAANQFLVNAVGGVGINTNSPVPGGVTVNGRIVAGGTGPSAAGAEPLAAKGSIAGLSLDDRTNGETARWVAYADQNWLNFWKSGTNVARLHDTGYFITNTVTAQTFVNLSDAAQKEGFVPTNPRSILQRVAELPILEWSFRNQPDIRHIGTTAQAFHAAFGFGADQHAIATVDADGVALAAIQGLHQVVQQQELQISNQERAIEALTARLEALQQSLVVQHADAESQRRELTELRGLVNVLLSRAPVATRIAQSH